MTESRAIDENKGRPCGRPWVQNRMKMERLAASADRKAREAEQH